LGDAILMFRELFFGRYLVVGNTYLGRRYDFGQRHEQSSRALASTPLWWDRVDLAGRSHIVMWKLQELRKQFDTQVSVYSLVTKRINISND
jgi:hypothetical protein